MEGALYKYAGRRLAERYVLLFDGLIVLTKQNNRRTSVTGPVGEYKLKEKFNIRKIDIVDKDDTEELKNAFELVVPNQSSVILHAKTQEEKNNWMAALVHLHIRSNLERMLDSALKDEEKQHPLKPLDPTVYRFSEKDSDENIVFEENQDPSTENRLIKGGTLLKLAERLTYHAYADPKFVRTFLTTYRTFCKPRELLELLIERFEIPDPEIDLVNVDLQEKEMRIREDMKRFRKEYSKPVQFRVLNVLRHWVDQHWYDFEDEELLNILNKFLESVKGKAMRKCVESITKIISRRLESSGTEKQKFITYQNQPPPIEWHLTRHREEFDLMTLHPVEIARQATLLEFDLYRAVKPSEMVGRVWIKKNKNITSPNLIKMIQHSTRFTFWLEKCIIEAENFEERVSVMSRILEIMCVFQEYNNFNGVLEVISALDSSAVFRLDHTFTEVWQKNPKLKKAYEEATELNKDHHKRYNEKLRSIDPPCVPFLGMYLTNILLLEEGNPDFLPKAPEGMINFKKRRKIAEITGEIQQYQNQPYCLTVYQDIRTFLEELDPLEDQSENQFSNYLFEKSQKIEPRNCKQPIKASKIREYPLKSPGIKAAYTRHGNVSSSSSSSTMKGERGTQLSSSPSPLSQEGGLEGDQQSVAGISPPSLSPPNSPNPDAVFHPVLIPNQLPANAPLSLATPSSAPPTPPLQAQAPPLPNFQPLTSPPPPPKPPVPPHRDMDDLPPPLPPRRKEASYSVSGDAPPERPPRSYPAPRLPPRSSSHATLPRYVSEPGRSRTPRRSESDNCNHRTTPRDWSQAEHRNPCGLRLPSGSEPETDFQNVPRGATAALVDNHLWPDVTDRSPPPPPSPSLSVSMNGDVQQDPPIPALPPRTYKNARCS